MALTKAILFCVIVGFASAYPQFGGNPFLQNAAQQSFPNQGFQNQGFPNQGFPNQGFQGFPGQGFQNQGFQNQGFPNQGFQNQGFPNQESLNQAGQNQGFPNNQFRPNPNNPFLPVNPQQNTGSFNPNQGSFGQNQGSFGQNQGSSGNSGQNQGNLGNVNQIDATEGTLEEFTQQKPGQQQPGQQQSGQQQPSVPTTPAAAPAQSPAFLQCVRNCQTTNEYNPVCGTDQTAYPNIRRLECANRCGQQTDPNWQEIRVFRDGACTSGQRVP